MTQIHRRTRRAVGSFRSLTSISLLPPHTFRRNAETCTLQLNTDGQMEHDAWAISPFSPAFFAAGGDHSLTPRARGRRPRTTSSPATRVTTGHWPSCPATRCSSTTQTTTTPYLDGRMVALAAAGSLVYKTSVSPARRFERYATPTRGGGKGRRCGVHHVRSPCFTGRGEQGRRWADLQDGGEAYKTEGRALGEPQASFTLDFRRQVFSDPFLPCSHSSPSLRSPSSLASAKPVLFVLPDRWVRPQHLRSHLIRADAPGLAAVGNAIVRL